MGPNFRDINEFYWARIYIIIITNKHYCSDDLPRRAVNIEKK